MNFGAAGVICGEGSSNAPCHCPAVRRPCVAAASSPADRGGRGSTRNLCAPLRRLRADGAGFHHVGHRSAAHGHAARLVSLDAGLAGAQRGLSRGRPRPVRRGRDSRACGGGMCGVRCRHDRHDLLDRCRHAQSRSARGAPHGVPPRCRARAGVRPWMRGWRLRSGARRSPGVRAARLDRSVRGDRDLYRGIPHGSADTGQHGRNCPLWRRRRSLRGPRWRGRSGYRADRRRGRASVAGHARHHGLESRPDRAGRRVRPLDSALRRAAGRAGSRRDPVASRRGARIGGSFRLPSGGRQGDHGAGGHVATRAGGARSRA